MSDYRKKSYWLEALPETVTPNPVLSGAQTADVVIMGGGYTGLSTGYHLKRLNPDLDVRLVAATLDTFGHVDALFNNAGVGPAGPMLETTPEDWRWIVDVNVLGPLRVSHYFGRRLAERGKGGIILMSSMSGLQGTAMVANYAATKAYDTVLAEGLWYELGQRGVDVLGCMKAFYLRSARHLRTCQPTALFEATTTAAMARMPGRRRVMMCPF